MKVMLDTNILILAFVFKSKKMNALINKLSMEHKIVICSYTIEELKELIADVDVFITGDKDFENVNIENQK